MSIWSTIEKRYAIKIRETVKVHDVYKVRTSNASFCLKRYLHPEDDVAFIARVLTRLDEQGFERSQRVYPTVEQAAYISHHGLFYVLTNWVEGDRPRFRKKADFKAAVRTLAKFHLKADGFPTADAPVSRIRYFDLQRELTEDRELLGRHPKTAHLAQLCDEVEYLLAQPFPTEAVASEQRLSALVHGDYNYPNLVKDRRRKLHLIDFENTSLNLRMRDLSHLLHRNFLWNGAEMLRWIEYYQRKRPLSSYDLHLLHALLTAPYHVVRNIRIGGYRHAKSMIPSGSQLRSYRRELRALQ